MHELTEEQEAICRFVASGEGSLVVEALAGSGKTFSILQAIEVLPQASAMICAFNRPIADELLAKLPVIPKGRVVHVKTFHALGLSILKNRYPKLEITKTATYEIINAARSSVILPFNAKRSAAKLLIQLKETYVGPVPTTDHVMRVGLDYNLFGKLPETIIAALCETVREAYELSLDLKSRETIDFCDMVWAPVACDLAPPSRYKAVLVDELQDMAQPQFALMQKILVPGGRFIGVGDRRQQIYAFRGSLGAEAWAAAKHAFNAEVLPLTTCFRCSKAVIAQAQSRVRQIKPAPDAIPGSVSSITWDQLPRRLAQNSSTKEIHTFILSRTNADLLDVALYLWNENVEFTLQAGKDIFEPLFDLIDSFDCSSSNAFRDSLNKWGLEELARAETAGAGTYADTIEEQSRMLFMMVDRTHPKQIKSLLVAMLKKNNAGVMLSTVHKVKGLEADRVFLLRDTFASGRIEAAQARMDEDNIEFDDPFVASALPSDEEFHIEYVAITRAREHLTWVSRHSYSAAQDSVDIEEKMLKQPKLDLKTLEPSTLTRLFEYAEHRAIDATDRKRNDQEASFWFEMAKRIQKVLS